MSKEMFKKGCSAYSELNDKRWLEQKYLEDGLNTIKIAGIVGCTYPTVLRALDRFGVPRRTRTEANIRFNELWDKEWLEKKYVEERISAGKIGSSLGCRNTAVIRALKHFGIRRRTPMESHLKRAELEDGALLESMYIDESKSIKAIGKLLGCSATTVARALKEHKIETRPQSEVFRGGTIFPELDDKDWLYQKYWIELLDGAEIGAIVGCNCCTVLRNLAKHKIPCRTISEVVSLSKRKRPRLRCRTSIEVVLEDIFNKHTDCIEYTGNGSFWITTPEGNINPDFIVKAKKIAIEANGDFWHSPLLNRNIKKGAVVTYREKHLRDVGWKLIVFWESDINRAEAEKYVLHVLRKWGVV